MLFRTAILCPLTGKIMGNAGNASYGSAKMGILCYLMHQSISNLPRLEQPSSSHDAQVVKAGGDSKVVLCVLGM